MNVSGRFHLRKIETAILLSAGFLLIVSGAAHAHRVNVFAWVEGDTVYTESRFPGGKAVKEGQIVVFDEVTGEKLLEGRTDESGAFSFQVPRRVSLRIELTAGMGHKNEWIVPAEEISAAVGVSAPDPASSAGEQAQRTAAGPEQVRRVLPQPDGRLVRGG